MFLLRQPSLSELEDLVGRSAELPLSYSPVGIAAHAPEGFRVDQAKVVVGRGEAAFLRAKAALLEWQHFHLGWLEVFPRRPSSEPGTVLVVLVHHLGFWSVNSCRVVYSVADSFEAQQFGFAYGTLTSHAERGEEVFRVYLSRETGEVVYDIKSVSRPGALLAWLGYPIARGLQAKFRRDSTAAMARCVLKC
jgi:uncharacterized protein (UPF0548 family)